MSAAPRSTLGASAGRCAGAARSSARSRCRRTARPRRRSRRRTNSVEPPPMSTTRNGAADGAASSSRSRRRRTAGLLRPDTTSGSTPSRSRTPSTKTRRGCSRRGSPRSRTKRTPLDAAASRQRLGVLGSTRRRCAPAPRGAAAGAVDALAEPDDLHPRSRSTSDPRRVDVGDQQPDRVGAAVDRRDPRHASPRRVGDDARAVGPPLGQPVERLVAERVDARAGGERVGDEHVQALDPVGMPPAEMPAISGTSPSGGPVGAGSPRARRAYGAARSGRRPAGPVISRIRPDASSVPIADGSRGQVR